MKVLYLILIISLFNHQVSPMNQKKEWEKVDISELNPYACDTINDKNNMVIIFSKDGITNSVLVKIYDDDVFKILPNIIFLKMKEGSTASTKKTDKICVQQNKVNDINVVFEFFSIESASFENLPEELYEEWIESINQEQK